MNTLAAGRRPIQAGLIGFGLAGRYFHTPLIQAAGIRVAGVVTSREPEVRDMLPDAEVFASSDALIRRDDIELVVIASPNQLHSQQATDALLADKHVVVDKPLCLTSMEAHELSQLASSRNRTLCVFHNRRWDSDFLTLRMLIEQDRLGEINAFHARWDRYRPQVADRWRERDEPGAGVLYDLGSHLIDQAVTLLGRPDWVQADVFRQRETALAADGFELLLGKDRLRITLGVSSIASDGGWRYRVHGSRASFLKNGLDVQEPQLRSGMSPHNPSFGVEPLEQSGTLVHAATGEREVIAPERGRWVAFYEAVRSHIEVGTPAPVPAAQACATIQIIEAAIRSSAEGRRVDLRS